MTPSLLLLESQVLNLTWVCPEIFAGRGMDDIISNELTNAGIVVFDCQRQRRSVGSSLGPGQRPERADHGPPHSPTHDRILQDFLALPANGRCAIGLGLRYHPTNFDQVSFFSSRGPVPDGRVTVGAGPGEITRASGQWGACSS